MTDRTAAEQAVEALREAMKRVHPNDPVHIRCAEALAALTAEAAPGMTDLMVPPETIGPYLDTESTRVSPDREALARRLSVASNELKTAPIYAKISREGIANLFDEAIIALRLPAQAEAMAMAMAKLINERANYLESAVAEKQAVAITVQSMRKCVAFLRSLPPAVGEWRPTHRHYKGGLYRVIGPGKIEADLSSVVIYESREGHRWVRPTDDFIGTIEVDGVTVQRFLPIPPALPQETKP